MSAPHLPRRLAAFGTAAALVIAPAIAGASVLAFAAAPAFAAGEGYVRLAHLSPDAPAVDVYLGAVNATAAPKKFPSVPYGVISDYQRLPTGTYAVAMRAEGAPATSQPLLTTQVTVATGKAYTVAGVGRHADLGLRVIDDDITLPSGGMAKVRVVQASVRAPILDVRVDGGDAIATGVAFASTTPYQLVEAGSLRVRVVATGGGQQTTRNTSIGAGNVYTLLILDAPQAGLTARLLIDARRQGGLPIGGVDAGGGGTADSGSGQYGLLLAGLLALIAATGGGWLLIRVRRPART